MTLRLARWWPLALLLGGCGSVQGDDGATDTARDDSAGGEVGDDAGADADAPETDAEAETVLPDVPDPHCGDGVVDGGEECDDGNETDDDGCTTDCSYSCHGTDDCDDGNQCTADSCTEVDAGRACVSAPLEDAACDDGNECTEGETCSAAGVCRGGASVCVCTGDDDCPNDDDLCNGTLVCTDHACIIQAGSVVVCPADLVGDCVHPACNPETGDCDDVPNEDGTSCNDGAYCTPTDACADGRCVGSGARCTRECEVCDETGHTCAVSPGWCLIGGSTCVADGTANPENACLYCNAALLPRAWHPRPSTTPCPDAHFCNGAETCDGAGVCRDNADPCPVGGCIAGCNESGDRCTPVSGGTVCRPSLGICDAAEQCSGTTTACPADGFASNTTVCRTDAGSCDVPEYCSGTSAACPTDRFEPDGTYCEIGPAAGSCRAGACVVPTAEVCNGADDDGDGSVDEGVSCTGYDGRLACPGEREWTDESCGVAGTCQECQCTGELTWVDCSTCSSCPY